MATPEQCKQRIEQLDYAEVIHLWEDVQNNATEDFWDQGKALEYLILRAFQLEGVEVRWPYPVSLHGDEVEQIDGVVYLNGLSCLIECKDRERNIKIEPVAKLRNQLLRRPGGVIGVIFSRSGFTDPAVTLAHYLHPNTALLWSGPEIDFALRQQGMTAGLVLKYRQAVEFGLPDYNLTLEDQL